MKSKYYKLYIEKYNPQSGNLNNPISTKKSISLFTAQNYVLNKVNSYNTIFTFKASVNLEDASIVAFNNTMHIYQKAYKAELKESNKASGKDKRIKHIIFTTENFVNAIPGYIYTKFLASLKSYKLICYKKVAPISTNEVNQSLIVTEKDFIKNTMPISLRPYLYFYPLISSFIEHNTTPNFNSNIKVIFEAPDNKLYAVVMNTSFKTVKEDWFLRLVEYPKDKQQPKSILLESKKEFKSITIENNKTMNLVKVFNVMSGKDCFGKFADFLDEVANKFEEIIGY